METGNKQSEADLGSRSHPGNMGGGQSDWIDPRTKQQVGNLGIEARTAGEQLRNSASETARQAKDMASEVAGQAQRKAADYAKQATSQGREMLDQQKQRAVEQAFTVSDAVRRAASKFRDEKDDNIAGYVDAAAEQIEELGTYLQRKDLNSLWRDAQSLGRRRPEWFLGGMFVAGLALTRFLKASAERRESNDHEGYSRSYSSRGYGISGEGSSLSDSSRASSGNRSSGVESALESSPSSHPINSSGTRGTSDSPSSAAMPSSLGTSTAGTAPGSAGAPSPSPYITPMPAPTMTVPTIYPATIPTPASMQPEVH